MKAVLAISLLIAGFRPGGTEESIFPGLAPRATLWRRSTADLSASLADDDPDESVARGRKALDRWSGYPWYDKANDDLKRVDLQPERQPRNFSLPGPFLKLLLWGLLAAALVAVGYLLFRAFVLLPRRKRWSDDENLVGDADRLQALPLPVKPGRLDLLGEARRHYEQGNYSQAIIYLFSFQLVQLDKRQIIRLDRGKTNRQYLREVGRRERLAGLLDQTMVAFEDVFFGGHSLDRRRFESCWSRLNEFEQLTAEATA